MTKIRRIKCPECNSFGIIKKGKHRNKQRYFCKKCNKKFQNKRRKSNLNNKIWKDYVYGKQTLKQLKEKYKISIPIIRKH